MHIVKDENGNVIPHGGCEHTHDYDSAQAHHHEHVHCEGENCSGCQNVDPKQQLTALLTYMLSHNQSHAAELDQMAEKIRSAGMEAAAEQIKKGVDEFQKGNMYLSLALSMVKESK